MKIVEEKVNFSKTQRRKVQNDFPHQKTSNHKHAQYK